MRRLACVLAIVLLASVAAMADDKGELQNLHSAMSSLTQEQQAVFQQFQMLQELRRANDQAFSATLLQAPLYPSEVPNYADLAQYQRDIARRGEQLTQQADQLYAQYSDIAAKKALLLQRIMEIVLSRQTLTAEQQQAR